MKKLLLVTLLFMPILGYSAGFNCKKATTWAEKSICVNDELSKLDELMTLVYKRKLAKDKELGIGTDFGKQEQRQWLKYHRNSCHSMGCLQREYKEYLCTRQFLKENRKSINIMS